MAPDIARDVTVPRVMAAYRHNLDAMAARLDGGYQYYELSAGGGDQ